MSKLIMWNLITLDGMFEGPKPWTLDAHEYAWGEELHRFRKNGASHIKGNPFDHWVQTRHW